MKGDVCVRHDGLKTRYQQIHAVFKSSKQIGFLGKHLKRSFLFNLYAALIETYRADELLQTSVFFEICHHQLNFISVLFWWFVNLVNKKTYHITCGKLISICLVLEFWFAQCNEDQNVGFTHIQYKKFKSLGQSNIFYSAGMHKIEKS